MLIGRESGEIPIVLASQEYQAHAFELCSAYGFTIFDSVGLDDISIGSYLFLGDEGLTLIGNTTAKERVRVDFLTGRSGYRLSTMSNTAQPALKAVGFNKDKMGLRVLDATAGLGVDGMLMACAGCCMTLLERSPVMAALLQDGIDRVFADNEATGLQEVISSRLKLLRGDSVEFFSKIEDGMYDVIYLDPMFPERKKSSKVKKEMQLAKFFTDSTDNAEELLIAALETPVRRVVIKRPLKSPVVKTGFSSQIKGKSIRFDVFIR